MDDAMKELGRRAIAAGFAWVPGCANQYGERVTRVVRHMNGADIEAWDPRAFGWTSSESYIGGDDVPDLSDPATVGCLDAQLAERFGCPVIVTPFGKMFRAWRMLPPDVDEFYYRLCAIRTATTPAGAIVAALDAAPKVAP